MSNPFPAIPWFGRTFRSLRHVNYRLYFVGQLISLTGSWMQTAALVWLAYALTGESKWPALVMIAHILPAFLLGAWGGYLADRCCKRTLVLRTQLAFLAIAVLLACLTFAGLKMVWPLIVIMFCNGLIHAIDLPARLALVPDLVDRNDLMNAVALNSLLFNSARATGPALAGLALLSVGPALCFLLNALSYLAVIIALKRMHLPAPPERKPEASSQRASVFSGFTYLRQRPDLAIVVLLAGGIGICGWPTLTLLPAFAQQVLQGGAQAYSLTLSAIGTGALCAALTVATFGNEERRRLLLLIGAGMVTSALGGLAQVHHFALAAFFCGMLGFGLVMFFATGQATLQLATTDEHRGRVMGIWAMMMSGATPIGNLLLGPLADWLGVVMAIRIQALFAGVVSLAVIAVVRRRGFQHTSQTPSRSPSASSGSSAV